MNTTSQELDLTKPVQTRGGRPVHHVTRVGDWVVGIIEGEDSPSIRHLSGDVCNLAALTRVQKLARRIKK